MGVNMRNSEGYYDPTVFHALSNIEREEKAKRAYKRANAPASHKSKPKHTFHIIKTSPKEVTKA